MKYRKAPAVPEEKELWCGRRFLHSGKGQDAVDDGARWDG